MASVYFDPAVGGDGSIVTDDANPTTGLANGGHRQRFVPALAQTVAVANTSVTSAATAVAASQTALNAPGTQGTSTTSLAIGTGSKSLTLAQTGKAFAVGMYVQIVSTASTQNTMVGAITAFDSGTGAMTVDVVYTSGSGTLASWAVTLAAPPEVPTQTGNAGAYLRTNGSSVSWTKTLDEVSAVTVASAATVDIGAQAANTINITGTTTITSLGTASAGVVRRLVFGAALTLTHNATTLILPGAGNITTAAGDVAEFISLGSGNWRCTQFQRYDGKAVKIVPSAAQVYAGPPTGTWSRAASKTGTYSQTTTVVTVTITAHGLTTGDYVYLDFTTGTATDAWFTVTVTDANTFTVTRTTATTSGNVTLHMPVVITVTSQSAHGLSNGNRATLTFNSTYQNASYVVRRVTTNSFQLDGTAVWQTYNGGTGTFTTQGSGSSGTVTFLSINRTATWTKPDGLVCVKVTVTGGGGQAMSGSTGGAGGTSIKTIAAASLGSTESVTVGRGGVEQMGSTASSVGTSGASSSFGAHCSATGGSGGDGNVLSGGGGGVGSGGDVNVFGGDGADQNNIPGSSFFGSGEAFGAGGTSKNGEFFQGSFGIVIVEEFY